MDTDYCICGKATSGDLYCSEECKHFDGQPRFSNCTLHRQCSVHTYPVMCQCDYSGHQKDESRPESSSSSNRSPNLRRTKVFENWSASPASSVSSLSPYTPSWAQADTQDSPSVLNLGPSATSEFSVYEGQTPKTRNSDYVNSRCWPASTDPGLELRYHRKPSQTAIASRQPVYTTPSSILAGSVDHSIATYFAESRQYASQMDKRDESSHSGATVANSLGVILSQNVRRLQRRRSDPAQHFMAVEQFDNSPSSARHKSVSDLQSASNAGVKAPGYMSRLRARIARLANLSDIAAFFGTVSDKNTTTERRAAARDTAYQALTSLSGKMSTLPNEPRNMANTEGSTIETRLLDQIQCCPAQVIPMAPYMSPVSRIHIKNNQVQGRGRTLSRAGNSDRKASPTKRLLIGA